MGPGQIKVAFFICPFFFFGQYSTHLEGLHSQPRLVQQHMLELQTWVFILVTRMSIHIGHKISYGPGPSSPQVTRGGFSSLVA